MAFTLFRCTTLFYVLFLFITLAYSSPAWIENRLKHQEQARRDQTCPNVPHPVDSWIDYSVKIRGIPEVVGSCSGLQRRDAYSCDEANPCSNNACCGKSGYCGYGEKYCGDGTTPNSVCWSNCDAKAECGINADPVNTTCPLNVCCSEFGFCGTTSDFCGTGCQSNCDMPDGSGTGDGDVQKRIVAYYEAWKVDSSCAAVNLGMKTMPLGSLTHLIVSFGYITPDNYNIAAMPGVTLDKLGQFAKLKEDNPNTKIMISLGGWSFTDDDTDTQAVYTTMVGSHSNRATFITNLLAFLSQYGFDGVDFDWEYPGAPDRGGNDGDAEGYLQLLSQLRVAQDLEGTNYTVSFTVPTSYYYLANYGTPVDSVFGNILRKMSLYADMINVMSYDLHGTWDGPQDQIGSIVLAHTNLTEIQVALDLFWRNDINPAKLNLGVGFYGRSYQLSSSSCTTPGCSFSGGGTAAECTKTSGILSYREIVEIIEANDLTPTWDKTAAVKYLVWDKDQWVSFDDQETFQQKIKWANANGIGGLSIWALDQDTDDLQALQALLYPGTLNAFYDNTTSSSAYEELNPGQCRLTDCNAAGCSVGEVSVTTQRCKDGNGKKGTSTLCCPLTSAPDPSTCTWRGTAPSCNGRCHTNEVAMEQNKWGDGKVCKDGNKVYCCAVPDGIAPDCRTTGCGGSCNDDEVSIAGEFFDNCLLEPKQLCCPTDSPYTANTCHWQGKDGSCYDNVCAFNTEVQLTQSYDGGGKDCGFQLSRDRVFCCTAPNSEQPFLPVPLDYLFENPPTDADASTKYKLAVDDTWGGAANSGIDEPDSAAFGFFVMAASSKLLVSFDKRDGSHWEFLECNAKAEEQTVRIVCTDDTPSSNCGQIRAGHGVPGTIVELPRECGPGRYAVAKDLVLATNQSLPGHVAHRLEKRDGAVYELSFDYDFRRVPRDDDDPVLWRLDYSNQEGYWDAVVDKPANARRRRRRALGPRDPGAHKRWLEDTFRDDMQEHRTGLLSRAELHERWFGQDAIDWIKNMFTVPSLSKDITHQIDETLNVILLDETYDCTIAGVDVNAKLLVQASTSVRIDTSYGLTITATLGLPPDLSQSYLYFQNKGKVSALFTVDALTTAQYDTGDIELFGLDDFGATFGIPGIVTVGPNFQLFGSVNVDLELSGKFQAQVNLAEWDTTLGFPEAEDAADPDEVTTPSADGTQSVLTPEIDWNVAASGQLTAHLKPAVSFGITFSSKFIDVDPATVNLVADGWVQTYASASYGSTSSEGVDLCYGANAGSDIYAALNVPSAIGWVLPSGVSFYSLYKSPSYAIIPKTCSSDPDNFARRSIDNLASPLALLPRATTIGPLVHLPQLSCPSSSSEDGNSTTMADCPLCSADAADDDDDGSVSKRATTICDIQVWDAPDDGSCTVSGSSISARGMGLGQDGLDVDNANSSGHVLNSRTAEKTGVVFNDFIVSFGRYKQCSEAESDSQIDKYFVFATSTGSCTPDMAKLSSSAMAASNKQTLMETDHVYEGQTLTSFFTWLANGVNVGTYTKPSEAWVKEVLLGIGQTFLLVAPGNNGLRTPAAGELVDDVMAYGFGRSDGTVGNTRLTKDRGSKCLTLLSRVINEKKGIWFSGHAPSVAPSISNPSNKRIRDHIRSVAGVFTYLAFEPAGTNPDSIWQKWMRTSNWIDLVCSYFDSQYAWGSRTDEPITSSGTASLRALYARFIDEYLATIEAKAATWSSLAERYYKQETPTMSSQEAAWYRAAFGANGFATSSKMRFPRPAGSGPSPYGAYANQQLTLNGGGSVVNLGNPSSV